MKRVNRSHKMLTMSPVVETRGLNYYQKRYEVQPWTVVSLWLGLSLKLADKELTKSSEKNNFENFSKFDITRYIFPGGSTDHC